METDKPDRPGQTEPEMPSTPRPEPETVCAQCGARYPGDLRGRFCDTCGSKL